MMMFGIGLEGCRATGATGWAGVRGRGDGGSGATPGMVTVSVASIGDTTAGGLGSSATHGLAHEQLQVPRLVNSFSCP